MGFSVNDMRRQLAVLAMLLGMSLPMLASEGLSYNLVVYTSDGARTTFASSEKPRLTISDSSFRFSADGRTIDYAAADLRRFTLEDSDGNALPQSYWLVISLRDGTIEACPFADRPVVTIKDDLFTVKSTTRTVGYPAKDIARFRLTDDYEVPATRGDVNGDGTVDVADISAIVSVMAGNTQEFDKQDSLQEAADVNADGVVDVADIAAVISIMAGK